MYMTPTTPLTCKEYPEVSVGRESRGDGDALYMRKFLIPSEWYQVELFDNKKKAGEFIGQFRCMQSFSRQPCFNVDKANDAPDGSYLKVDGIRQVNLYDRPNITWLYWLNEGELPDDPMLCTQLAEAYIEYDLMSHFIPEDSPCQQVGLVPNLLARAIQMGYRPWNQDKDPVWGYIERMNPHVRAC